MTCPSARCGFSLIEALVVLAISGMALAIIFSIGLKAGDAGFALGRNAMSAADVDVATGDVRSIIRSVVVRPARTFMAEVDQPFLGTRERFEGDVVMERATQCAPAGWAGRIILSIERRGPEQALVCRAGTREVTLLITRDPNAALSYSADGRIWSWDWTNAPSGNVGLRPLRAEAIYIRFNGGLKADIVEMASSGRPEAWARRIATL